MERAEQVRGRPSEHIRRNKEERCVAIRVSFFARQLIQQPKRQSHVGYLAARNVVVSLLASANLGNALWKEIGPQQFLAVILQKRIRCPVGGEHLPNTLQCG